MDVRAWATLMAEYNAWMNARLFDLASTLTDEERRRDLGAFFGSIHGTLDHIVQIDRVFLGRLLDREAILPPAGTLAHDDFRELWRERQTYDRELLDWAAACPPTPPIGWFASAGRRRACCRSTS